MPTGILPILLAIVWKVASDAVLTPLPVIALAISDFPLLTDVFKELISLDALHWIEEGCVYTVSFVSSSLFLPAYTLLLQTNIFPSLRIKLKRVVSYMENV